MKQDLTLMIWWYICIEQLLKYLNLRDMIASLRRKNVQVKSVKIHYLLLNSRGKRKKGFCLTFKLN